MNDQILDGYQLFTHMPPEFREDRCDFWYGDLTLDRPTPFTPQYIMPDLLSGSDYSGSAVERSNYQTFLDAFGDLPGVHPVTGGYGTYAIAIHRKTYEVAARSSSHSHHDTIARLAEMYETLTALEDYPVLDDEAMYELEREWQNEAWDWTIRGDYLTALAERIQALAEDQDLYATIDWLDVDDGLIRQTFETAADDACIYWETENSSSWIDAAQVAQATPLDAVTGWIDWLYTEVE
jgi:hypothetical protein